MSVNGKKCKSQPQLSWYVLPQGRHLCQQAQHLTWPLTRISRRNPLPCSETEKPIGTSDPETATISLFRSMTDWLVLTNAPVVVHNRNDCEGNRTGDGRRAHFGILHKKTHHRSAVTSTEYLCSSLDLWITPQTRSYGIFTFSFGSLYQSGKAAGASTFRHVRYLRLSIVLQEGTTSDKNSKVLHER